MIEFLITQFSEFKNTPNECVELKDGKKVFLSRALTVCVPVTAINKFNEKFYLVSIRGSKTPDFQHCFNIVCGYLDYDECLIEASKRELFEETGFFVDAVNKDLKITEKNVTVIYNTGEKTSTKIHQ